MVLRKEEDPEFWQCACEQQICSRPRADWHLSGERVREVLQCGSPAPVTGVPALLLLNICPARCVVFAWSTLHTDNTGDSSTPRQRMHSLSWCCSRSQFSRGCGPGHTPRRPVDCGVTAIFELNFPKEDEGMGGAGRRRQDREKACMHVW